MTLAKLERRLFTQQMIDEMNREYRRIQLDLRRVERKRQELLRERTWGTK